MRHVFWRAALVVTFVAAAPGVHAGSTPRKTPPTRVSPLASMLLEHHRETGHMLPWLERNAQFEASGRLPVVVRFSRVPSGPELAQLETQGALLGSRPTASGAYLGRVDARGLAALEATPQVSSITPDVHVRGPRPLDASRRESGVDSAVRALRVKDGTLLDGTGTTIVDIDSPIYIFHPALFRADAGHAAWVDVDGNGTFDPGVDGVDLDGDGTIAPAEVLHRLVGHVLSAQLAEMGASTTFQPGVDFLYCDSNANGKRDHGAPAFSEDTPAYGEPLFVFDDANADGAAARSEKVLRLGTSKIKMVRNDGEVFVRGGTGKSALINFDPTSTPQGMSDSFHATGVSGILVSGTPGISRYLGLAPNADLIVGTTMEEPAAVIAWALEQKPDVILTEYAPYNVVTLDGSSEEDAMYDAALGEGAVVVSPAGNLAGSNKHDTMTFQPGPNTFTIPTDSYFKGSAAIQLSLHHRSATARKIALTLKLPGSDAIFPIVENGNAGTSIGEGRKVYAYSQTTARSTHELHVILYDGATPLPEGTYEVTATVDAGPAIEVDGYVGDGINSWSNGATFAQGDDARTICSPSTGDSTISVAAYVLHEEKEYQPAGKRGALASYSSRGPRIDGQAKIGVGAPDNPMSLAPPLSAKAPVAYYPFGGTSGAGPHVAASVALLKQLYPKELAEKRRTRILGSARREATMSSVKDGWGAGKLDMAAAAALSLAEGAGPKIRLAAPRTAPSGSDVELSVEVLEGGSPETLAARWDLDYDGAADTAWAGLETVRVPAAAPGSVLTVRVEVLDAHGNVVADTARVEIGEKAPEVTGAQLSESEESGCGCRIPAREGRASGAGLLLGLAAVAMAAARRARRAA